jgi:hypothetical protein
MRDSPLNCIWTSKNFCLLMGMINTCLNYLERAYSYLFLVTRYREDQLFI